MTYLTLIPLILSSPAYYGLAMAMPPYSDATLLGAEWRYSWGPLDPYPDAAGEFVPMLWSGRPSPLVAEDYSGYLLAMNEPDNPNQLGISPEEASRRLAALRQAYPRAVIVAPGVLSYNLDWMRAFIACGVQPDVWAYHAYVEGPHDTGAVIDQLEQMHRITGGRVWVTEFGILNGSTDDLARLMEWMRSRSWIERIAVYTNREDASAAWAVGTNLVEPDGTLNQMGRTYLNR